MDDPAASFARAQTRYESWLSDPERPAWHSCKRTFAYALMIHGGLAPDDVEPYLLACPWFTDFSRHVFRVEPSEFVQPFVDEVLRSGAAAWRDGRLVALTPHTPPADGWLRGPHRPATWPPVAPHSTVS